MLWFNTYVFSVLSYDLSVDESKEIVNFNRVECNDSLKIRKVIIPLKYITETNIYYHCMDILVNDHFEKIY